LINSWPSYAYQLSHTPYFNLKFKNQNLKLSSYFNIDEAKILNHRRDCYVKIIL